MYVCRIRTGQSETFTQLNEIFVPTILTVVHSAWKRKNRMFVTLRLSTFLKNQTATENHVEKGIFEKILDFIRLHIFLNDRFQLI